MRKEERMEKLIDATMQIIAEKGLNGFSMIQVSKKAGINEGLMYRDFGTKNNLLFSCYDTFNHEIGQLFTNIEFHSRKIPIHDQIHILWKLYFDFLVKSTYKTIFYLEYRDSQYINTILEKKKEIIERDFNRHAIYTDRLRQICPELTEDMEKYIRTYSLDCTGIFAKRVIRGELPNTEESADIVWSFMKKGIDGLFPEDVYLLNEEA